MCYSEYSVPDFTLILKPNEIFSNNASKYSGRFGVGNLNLFI